MGRSMFDPRLLRAFVAIVDAGGFTQAAARLNVTQSTISQQLARLEEAVGQSLVDRSGRPVTPSPAGERLLGHARRILALQEEAGRLLADPAGVMAIRIGMAEDLITAPMMALFARFAARRREARLDVASGLSRDLARRYRDGEFDIVAIKEAEARPGCRASFPEPMAWFEGAGCAGDWPDPLPLVTFPAGGLYRDAMFARAGREGLGWYVAFSGSSLHNVLVAVEAGLGVSLLPVNATRGRRLRRHSLGSEPGMVANIYVGEPAGPVSELADGMVAVLAARAHAGAGDGPQDGPPT